MTNNRPDRVAATFQPNPLYDRLLALQERDPAAYYATTTLSMRKAIGQYVEARDAHAQRVKETQS